MIGTRVCNFLHIILYKPSIRPLIICICIGLLLSVFITLSIPFLIYNMHICYYMQFPFYLIFKALPICDSYLRALFFNILLLALYVCMLILSILIVILVIAGIICIVLFLVHTLKAWYRQFREDINSAVEQA